MCVCACGGGRAHARARMCVRDCTMNKKVRSVIFIFADREFSVYYFLVQFPFVCFFQCVSLFLILTEIYISPSNNTSSNQRLLSISSSFFFFSSLFKQKRRVLKAFFKVNLNYLNSSDVCFEVYNFSSGVAPTQKRYSNKWVFAITKQSQLSINSL